MKLVIKSLASGCSHNQSSIRVYLFIAKFLTMCMS